MHELPQDVFNFCSGGRPRFRAYTETNKVGGDPGRVRTAAASRPSVTSRGRGVTKRESRGEQTKTDPCSPLECLSWLMFQTMVALVPEL